MGACASRPKDLDADACPEPLPETVDNPVVEKVEESNNEGEAAKEEPVVDLSEPKEEAPTSSEEEAKAEEVDLLSGAEPKEAEEAKAEEAAKEVDEVAAGEDKSDEPLVTV